MSARLYYLLSSLPPLPGFGEALPCRIEDVLATVRTEANASIDALADGFSIEPAVWAIIRSRMVKNAATPPAEQMELLPDSIRETASAWPADGAEVVWHETVWRSWLKHMHDVGLSIGSRLLQHWSAWEMALEIHLADIRENGEFSSGKTRKLPADTPSYDYTALAVEWHNTADPMVGEHKLDEARFDFLAAESTRYSFELDELVSYLLKLRLLSRYARLDRGAALKILEEVTAL